MNIVKKQFSSKDWWIDLLVFIAILLGCVIGNEIFIPKTNWIAGNDHEGASSPSIVLGSSIAQPFTALKNNLSSIKVIFLKQDTPYPENGTINWVLVEEKPSISIIAAGSITVGEIENGKEYFISFPAIRDSSFKNYKIIFMTSSLPEGISLSTSLHSQSTPLAYQINENNQDGTLKFFLGYLKPDYSLKTFLGELAIAFLLWLIYLFRTPICQFINSIPMFEVVLIIITVFGLLFLIIEPPLKMFDEPEHFRRIWEISQGNLSVSTIDGVVANRLPEYIQVTFDRISRSIVGTSQNPVQLLWMLFEPAGDANQLSKQVGLTSSYSFFAYLFPALFVKLGVSLGSSALGLIYLARLANLVLYLILVTWAIRVARIGKYTIAAMATTSLILTQGVAIGVDSLLFAGSFLFFSSVINVAYSNVDERPNALEIAGIIVGAFCILASKHVYIPLLGLILLIPPKKFGSARNKIIISAIFFIAAAVFTIYLQSLITIGSDPRIDYSNINFTEQLNFVLNHPIAALGIFLNTLFKNAPDYIDQYQLLNSTYQNIGILGLVQIISVLFFSWVESRDFWGKTTIFDNAVVVLIVILSLIMILLPLYLTWTPIGAPIVQGVQGRYFAPIITLCLLYFKPPLRGREVLYTNSFLFVSAFILIGYLWITLSFFY